MIDTHAHLDSPQFDKDREKVIQEAKSCGVERILNVGVDQESSQKSVDLAQRYPQIYATVGFHPHDAKKFNQSSLEELRRLAQHQKVVALGEMGLDFYRNLSPAEIQKSVFISQLELAGELDMPVVVHIRNAYPQSLDILEQRKSVKGVLHCFEGDIQEAKRGLDLGFYISFNGRITYHNPSLIDLVKKLPLDRILVETDSPYLPPHPHKGQRNQPAWVELVIREIAQIKGKLVFEELEKITTINACNLFGWKQDEE
ncbi:MAG TPA: TatD family hydrolase [candidate division Zixibacteria bacterium]